MKCSNTCCFQMHNLNFTCSLCKLLKYCSEDCAKGDSEHLAICKEQYQAKLLQIESTSPFAKPGIYLNEEGSDTHAAAEIKSPQAKQIEDGLRKQLLPSCPSSPCNPCRPCSPCSPRSPHSPHSPTIPCIPSSPTSPCNRSSPASPSSFSSPASPTSPTSPSNICGPYEKVNIGKTLSHVLGKGSYGEVWLVKHKKTNQLYAAKVIDKTKLLCNRNPEIVLKDLHKEILIQKRLIHSNIIRLLEYLEDSKAIYLIIQYASKGTLFQMIRKKKLLSEKEAFYYFCQTCSAIYFLHKHALIHRDIKPENLLITESGIVKLCDFGCCTSLMDAKDGQGRKAFCGTVEYMAPEIVRREGYNEKVDIWSLGVLLYEMLHGYAPFTVGEPKAKNLILNRVREIKIP